MAYLVGILNITPDSFSDGGCWTSTGAAVNHAITLRQHGAEVIDIGGDSTRPGSSCVGAEEEWRRIKDAIFEIVKFSPISVDTHHPSTAAKAIQFGAQYINDVSGGSNDEMWRVIRDSDASYIVMHSRCKEPHDFSSSLEKDVIESVRAFWEEIQEKADRFEISKGRIILDPGMGGFLSAKPEDSYRLLAELPSLFKDTPILLGISRKGFLKSDQERSIQDRDLRSAEIGASLANLIPNLFLRVHNVKVHSKLLGITPSGTDIY